MFLCWNSAGGFVWIKNERDGGQWVDVMKKRGRFDPATDSIQLQK